MVGVGSNNIYGIIFITSYGPDFSEDAFVEKAIGTVFAMLYASSPQE